MGANLALEAVAYCNTKQIEATPRVLLMWMALRALDDDSARPGSPARRSFMRRQELAVGLGRMMPDRKPREDDVEALRAWDADDQAVTRCLRRLKVANAIEEVGRAHNGRTVEYEINLGRPSSLTVPLSSTVSVPVGGRSVKNPPSLSVPPIRTDEKEKKPGRQPRPTQAPHFIPVDNSEVEQIAS